METANNQMNTTADVKTMSEQPIELLPCPFCGSTDVALSFNSTDYMDQMVLCSGCYCDGPLVANNDSGKRDQKAIELWNKRAPAPSRIRRLLMNKLQEVHNSIGGVIGYTLSLDIDETEELMREIERSERKV